ncbi:MAG: HlyD family efflux transporter periplasmic adaptor subunit [Planctomycetota bacterium]
MTRLRTWRAGLLAAALLTSVSLIAFTRAPDQGSAPKDVNAMTATVEKKDLPIEVEVTGSFQAVDKERVALEPDEYSGDLIIKSIVAEGAAVKMGDHLLEFEVESLKKAMTDAEGDVSEAEVKVQKAQADLESLKIDQDVELKRVMKELELAQQAVQGEDETCATKRGEKETEIRRKENSIKDQEVNFEQLKKLYDSRDLHTSTESILVEREQKQLDESKFDFEKMKRDFEHFKKYTLYVDLEKKKLDVLKQEGEKKKQELKFAADLAEKNGAIKKAEREVTKAKEKVEHLQKDLANLRVTSPRDGVVFYGTLGSDDVFEDVVVFGSSGVRQNLRIGGRVRTHETLLTVASMAKLSVEMKVLENDIQHMREGLKITVRPDAFPDLAIAGALEKVDQVASRSGFLSSVQQFKIKAAYEGTYPQLRAGMNCRVTVHADSIPEATQVPVVAVFEEEGKYFCYADEAGKPVKRQVKLGATNGQNVQIVEGVKASETVYLYDPFRG